MICLNHKAPMTLDDQYIYRCGKGCGLSKYPRTQEQLQAWHWTEIDEDKYMWLLECVPPRRWVGPAFAVGEPMCDMDDGTTLYEICVRCDNRYFKKIGSLDFDPHQMCSEIRKQLAEG